MAYLTKDEFAIKKNYADWDTYFAAKGYPLEAAMDDMIEEMSDIMNDHAGVTTDVTDDQYVKRLRRICYDGVCYMMDADQQRAHERERTMIIPRLFMRPDDRAWLRNVIGKIKTTRKVGKIVF